MRKLVLLGLIIGGIYFGIKYLSTGSRFERFLDSHSEWKWVPAVEYYTGEFHVVFANWDKALYKFERIIKNYPESNWASKSQFAIAKVYDDKGEMKTAAREYKKVIDKYPESKYANFAEKRYNILR